jgi:hypothetical protein
MAMEGLGQPRGCESIHDDLFVRALYLSDGGMEALILGFDLLFFERPDVARFKDALGRALALKPEQIFLNTSHNHAGPRLTHWAYSEGADPAYLDRIEAAILDAAGRAKAKAVAVTLWAGEARTDLPVSRRQPDTSGRAQWKPYRQGTICDALPFCLFKDGRNQVVALLFSVSCHPSMIYECVISAEYPGAAMRKLNAHFQTEGSLFLQGAGGETKPRYVADGEERWRRGTWDEMEAAGLEVADAVIMQAIRSLTKVEPDLRYSLSDLAWPLSPPQSKTYYEAVLHAKDEQLGRLHWAKDMLRHLDLNGRLPESVPVALHALQLGKGLRLIGVEGELVAPLGLLIRSEFKEGVTFPLGYSNGCQIYLASTAMLPEGGYEVDSYWEYHWPSPLAPDGEHVLLDALRQLRGPSGHAS